jgi:hypothetical protein
MVEQQNGGLYLLTSVVSIPSPTTCARLVVGDVVLEGSASLVDTLSQRRIMYLRGRGFMLK